MATVKFPPGLEIAPGVLDSIETHAYSNLTAEVGGMLVGNVANGVTNIVGYVPAVTAAAEQISLTFTHDVWAEILTEVGKKFPESQIVGWYHTHPSFGLFLSQYDEFIQLNFFSGPGQVALVIDPIAGEMAWFAERSKKIEEFGRTATGRGPMQQPEMVAGQKVAKTHPLKVALIAIGASIVTGALVWGAVQATLPPDTSKALQERNKENSSLQNQVAAFGQILKSPVLVYRVGENEDLSSIVQRFYNSDQSEMVLAANGFSSAGQVVAGTQLLLPKVPGISVSNLTNEQATAPKSPSPTVTPPQSPTPTPTPTSSGSSKSS